MLVGFFGRFTVSDQGTKPKVVNGKRVRKNPKSAVMLTIQGVVFLVLLLVLLPKPQRTLSDPFPLDGFPSLGNPNAAVSLVVFEDWLCPGCRTFFEDHLPGLVEAFVDSGEVRLVTVPLPVVGAGSVRLAQASLCVFMLDEGSYWDVKPVAYRARGLGSLSSAEDLMRLVEQVAPAVDVGELVACTDSEVVVDVVRLVVARARERGIVSTPTVLVNDVVVQPTSAARAAELIRVALR
jgi:protein-disulfide isomerase